MKSLFVSMPIKGKTDDEVREEVGTCLAWAQDIVGEPLKTVDLECPWPDCSETYAFGFMTMLMSLCDYVCFAGDWVDDFNCRMQFEIAKEHNLNILF